MGYKGQRSTAVCPEGVPPVRVLGPLELVDLPATMDVTSRRLDCEAPSPALIGGLLRVGIIAPPWLPVPPVAYCGTENVIDILARGLQLRRKVPFITSCRPCRWRQSQRPSDETRILGIWPWTGARGLWSDVVMVVATRAPAEELDLAGAAGL